MKIENFSDRVSLTGNDGTVYKLPDGHLTREDEDLLIRHCSGKKLCVDIGTFKGRSAIVMRSACDNIVTIDEFPVGKPADFAQIKASLGLYGIRVMRSISNQAAKEFNKNSIDVLFLDAGHSADDVICDVEHFIGKIKDNGIIIFHDYKYMNGATDESTDVQKGVRLSIERGYIEQVEIAGWCFVARKKPAAVYEPEKEKIEFVTPEQQADPVYTSSMGLDAKSIPDGMVIDAPKKRGRKKKEESL